MERATDKSIALGKLLRLTFMTCLSFVFVSQLVFTSVALASGQKARQLSKGKQLLTAQCSRCHAVGLTDESNHPDAPHFRDLSKNYPVEYLAEALAEEILVGHPDMPTFQFDADQVEQIILYLESIQSSNR